MTTKEIKYLGNNPTFKAIVSHLNSTQLRFDSQDKEKRTKYPLTAALLDVYSFAYSKRLRIRHQHQLLRAVKSSIQLAVEDMEIV